MMNLKYLAAALAVAVVGCAQQPAKLADSEPSPPGEETPAPAPEPKLPPLPKQELSEEVLYQFLLAEVAGQRGKLDVATQVYLEVAKTTRDPRFAQRATEVALYSRAPETALEAARLWLETDPSSFRARQVITTLLVNSGRLDGARPHIEKLLSAAGSNIGHGFLQLNALLGKAPDKAAVFGLVREVAKPYPDVAEAHFAVAQAAWNAGEYAAALGEVRSAAALRPEWEAAALFQAQILQRDSTARAIEHLRLYLTDYPKAKDVRLNYARLLVAARNYAQARGEFQKLLADFPQNPEVTLAVGLLSMQLKEFDLAETQLKRLLELDYKDPDMARIYLGQTFEERKRYDEAARWYDSVEAGERYVTAQVRRANLLVKQDKLGEAREYLHRVPAQNNQQRVQLILAEAQFLREKQAYQEAFDVIGKALEKLPNYPELLYDYAMTAEKLDRLDILEANLRKLIQLKPDHAHAYNALGYTLADRTDRLQEAATLIETALKLAPDDPAVIDSMGWVQYRMGNLDTGLDYLRRAYAGNTDPEIAAHLGEVLWMHGRHAEAEKIWRDSLKEHPDNTVLQNTVKKFLPK